MVRRNQLKRLTMLSSKQEKQIKNKRFEHSLQIILRKKKNDTQNKYHNMHAAIP